MVLFRFHRSKAAVIPFTKEQFFTAMKLKASATVSKHNSTLMAIEQR